VKGIGTASSLTDAVLHTGTDSLNPVQPLSRSSLFLPLGDGAFGWSLLSHHHSLTEPRAMEPVLLQHQALLRQWPFQARPEVLSGECRRRAGNPSLQRWLLCNIMTCQVGGQRGSTPRERAGAGITGDASPCFSRDSGPQDLKSCHLPQGHLGTYQGCFEQVIC